MRSNSTTGPKEPMIPEDLMLGRARNIFFSQWEEILRLRLVVLKGCEHEDIHDLRVASRRLRAAINLLSPLCDSTQVQKVSKDIRKLTRMLGTLRNLDEALAFFGSHAGRIVLPGLNGRLATMREHEQQKVIMALKGLKTKKLDSLVRDMVADMTADNLEMRGIPPLPSYLSNSAVSLFATVHTLVPAALSADGAEERHALRIAIKKWRYFLEIVSKIVERNYDTVLERLKKYQSLLGRMNDMTEFAVMCLESGDTADEREAVKQVLIAESERLYNEFVALVAAEPLSYTFQI